jgi:hypothetical protein
MLRSAQEGEYVRSRSPTFLMPDQGEIDLVTGGGDCSFMVQELTSAAKAALIVPGLTARVELVPFPVCENIFVHES